MNKFILIILFSLATAAFYGQNNVRNFSSLDLREDFLLLKQALVEAHPGLYRYNDKERIDSVFNAVEQKLTDPTNVEAGDAGGTLNSVLRL